MVNAVPVYAASLMPVSELTSGEAMKQLRKDRGLSLRGAAKAAGVSHGTIQNLEEKGIDGVSFSVASRVATAYGVSLANLQRIDKGLEPLTESAIKGLGQHQVHPDWVPMPVFGPVAAGDPEAEPRSGDVVYVPREHLARRGAAIDTTRVYQVNGTCMISPEAMRVERTFAPGDYVAVDIAKTAEPGDVVVAWWDDREVMVIKRYGVDRNGIVLTPISPGRPAISLPEDAHVQIVGPVVWRGG